MKNNLTCELVEDLMPSYIDGLTNDVTNTAVREHLSHCDKCKAKLDTMKEPCSEDKIELEKKEIDFLKKNRRKNIRTKLISLIAVVLVVIIAVGTLPYLGKERLSEYALLYDLEVQGNTFKVTLVPTDNDKIITDVERSSYGLGEHGIEVKGRKRSLFDNKESFTWEYTYPGAVKTFKLGDKILWEDGEYISDITAEVFNHAHPPYVGDVTANAGLAYSLEIERYVGDYTTKLHTIAEPYGWSMILSYEILPEYAGEKEALMRKYSYVLLALVDNVDYITFEYEIFNSDGDDEKRQLTTTRAQADEYFGDDIRKCSEDINELQKLMEMTGIADLPYAQQGDRFSPDSGSFERLYFRILNNSDADIKSIHMTWLDDETESSMGFGIERDLLNFGESRVNPGIYKFSLDELSSNLYDEKRLGTTEFQITVNDFDGNEYILEDTVKVSAQFGAVYYLVLEGTFEEGFTVKIK